MYRYAAVNTLLLLLMLLLLRLSPASMQGERHPGPGGFLRRRRRRQGWDDNDVTAESRKLEEQAAFWIRPDPCGQVVQNLRRLVLYDGSGQQRPISMTGDG